MDTGVDRGGGSGRGEGCEGKMQGFAEAITRGAQPSMRERAAPALSMVTAIDQPWMVSVNDFLALPLLTVARLLERPSNVSQSTTERILRF